MNAQNPGQAKPSDPKSDDVAKVADKPKPVEAAKPDAAPAPVETEAVESEPAAEAKPEPVEVTLKHPVTDDTIKVAKPSADYTNFVRGYGYREVTK